MESSQYCLSPPASRPHSSKGGSRGAPMNDDIISIPGGYDRLPSFLMDKLEQKKSIREADLLKKQMATNTMAFSRAASRSGGRRDLVALLGTGSKLNAAQREQLAKLYISHGGALKTDAPLDALRGENNVFLTMTDATSIGMTDFSISAGSRGLHSKLRPLSNAGARSSGKVPSFDNAEELLKNAGNRVRYFYKPRGIEVVSSPVRVQTSSTRDLKEAHRQQLRKAESTVVVREEGNDGFVQEAARVCIGPGIKTGDSVEHPNREYIVAQTKAYYRNKAKLSADEVRRMREGYSADHAVEKGKLHKVFISKRIHAFRKAILNYLERRKDPQRGEIMKQIKDDLLFEFMELYKGYTMSPETIIGLLGASLGMSLTSPIVDEDFESNNVGRLNLHISDLAVASSPGGSPTLRLKTYISTRNEAISPLKDLIDGDSGRNKAAMRFSAGAYAPPSEPHFNLTSRPTSRHGAGFIVPKVDATAPSFQPNSIVEVHRAVAMVPHYSATTPSVPDVVGIPFHGFNSYARTEDSTAVYADTTQSSNWATQTATHSDPRAVHPLGHASEQIIGGGPDEGRVKVVSIADSLEEDAEAVDDTSAAPRNPSEERASPVTGATQRSEGHFRKRRVHKPLGPEPEKVLSDAEIAALANKTLSVDDLLRKKKSMLRADERLSNLLK